MLKVGLTGGIACGKSHVARRLVAHGLPVLDLDTVAHQVMAPGGAGHADVVQAFGQGILTPEGAIDRRALAARVFGDPLALARLNALVHPRVREEESRRAQTLAGTSAVLVSEAALLVESGSHLRFDRLVVVDCRSEDQAQRLAAREGMTPETSRARMAAQMPLDEKRRFAHLLIDGSLTLADTDRQADALAETLRGLAAQPVVGLTVPHDRALGALAHGPQTGPRGLTPAAVLLDVAEAGAVEMERLAARLDPPAAGPWYRAADQAGGGPPDALAVAVALWSLARRGTDADYTAAVAASLARLTDRGAGAIADACLAALAVAHVAAGGALGSLPARWADWSRLGERWAGGPPSARIEREAAAAAGLAARGPLAGEPGRDGSLAGALAALAAGTHVGSPPRDQVRALESLAEIARGG
jgi:dephospho-CoA kinase